MSRYIDADDFENVMYHEAFETDTEMQRWDSGCWIRYKLFENLLEKQPTADVVPAAQQWIPCSERLPKEDDYVLATVDYGDVTIAEYLGGNNWFTQEGNANAHTEEILAWMPMPQPWRGGDAK